MIQPQSYLYLVPFCAFLSGYLLFTRCVPQTTTTTPDLITLELPKALRHASEQRLNLRILKEQEDITLPDGTVIDQLPRAHTVVRPQQTMWVTITKKPLPYNIVCIGKTTAELEELARTQGLNLVAYNIPTDSTSAQCIAQSPTPKEMFTEKNLTCYVSKPRKAMFTAPHLISRNLKEIRAALEGEQLTIDVIYRFAELASVDENLLIVTDQRPLPGHLCRSAEKLYLQLFVQQTAVKP